ncbi:MAG: dehydrogenase [Bacteroidetes bacterium MedPE-SWsnd-G1]|nr:MAG: dehydrogenase [Bacteroidetes bacterium MedPE-SWsnd-G1]
MNLNRIFVLLILLCSIVSSCKNDEFNETKISLENYVIEEGFKVEAIASEPFIEAPVAMDFDNEGRMWVVEMKGYMQTIEGLSQEMPNGTISILEDLDKDGVADHSKLFMKDLVLPRALAHVYGGLLYAEPPNLWFVNIENDKPKNKVLVDSLYADGGNVEHQPNGLMMHTDNWIYNAKSNFRYQRKNGIWHKEPTSYRGQWGITKDNFGRLYVNNNAIQLMGDHVLPNTAIGNPYHTPRKLINKTLTESQRVYPLHATSVNRGYMKGVLDKDSILVDVTSACGPLIYRGSTFPHSHSQNAFVCAPEANLIKRNILTFNGDITNAKYAWDDREFLASTDEGFRPVNLFNGPDGNMYIVDMHRGIIQDKAYMSPYLKEQLAIKQLDTIIGMGRILKVSPSNFKETPLPNLEALTSKELVNKLESKDGWIRDRVQHMLVYQHNLDAAPMLKELIEISKNELAKTHALYALEGLDQLSFNLLYEYASSISDIDFMSHCLVLLEKYAFKENDSKMIELINSALEKNDIQLDLYVALSLGKWTNISPKLFLPILKTINKKHLNNERFNDAIISSLSNKEESFLMAIENPNNSIKEELIQVITNKETDKKNSIFVNESVSTDSRTSGYYLFKNTCATCHGSGGDGISGVAPPLSNSEFVTGSDETLARIILHGLHGPITVNGIDYEFNGEMPGLVNNPTITNKDVSDIISYLRNAFTTKSKKITLDEIESIRNETPKDGNSYTQEEINSLKN